MLNAGAPCCSTIVVTAFSCVQCGSNFRAKILTVVTARSQNRGILDPARSKSRIESAAAAVADPPGRAGPP
eukprot:7419159-Pyramimonas_sp.AAC.1